VTGKVLHSRGGSISNTSTCYQVLHMKHWHFLKIGNNERKIEHSGNQPIPVHLGSIFLQRHSGALGWWGIGVLGCWGSGRKLVASTIAVLGADSNGNSKLGTSWKNSFSVKWSSEKCHSIKIKCYSNKISITNWHNLKINALHSDSFENEIGSTHLNGVTRCCLHNFIWKT